MLNDLGGSHDGNVEADRVGLQLKGKPVQREGSPGNDWWTVPTSVHAHALGLTFRLSLKGIVRRIFSRLARSRVGSRRHNPKKKIPSECLCTASSLRSLVNSMTIPHGWIDHQVRSNKLESQWVTIRPERSVDRALRRHARPLRLHFGCGSRQHLVAHSHSPGALDQL